MAVQTAYERRKSVGRRVFVSVFVATIILSFFMLSFIGFSMMENILMSGIVVLSAFMVSIISSVSVTNRVAPYHMSLVSSNSYAAPTAFSSDSRHYSPNARPKIVDEANSCRRCNQVMLSGISTCPRCGWYKGF